MRLKFFIILLFAAGLCAATALYFISKKYQPVYVTVPGFSHPPKNTPIHNSQNIAKTETQLPAELNLPVPFTPQAPSANWDELHNEACEEAAAIMSSAYFASSSEITLKPEFVENEINKLTLWQDQNFGYHLDTTLEETGQIISEVYGLKTKVIKDFTLNDIKTELAQNHLIIISESGRMLKNPYYKQPGPLYHMLLIRGYDQDNLITNDSGTKNGMNYLYSFSTIYDAAADWDHKTNSLDQTKKTALAVWKDK